MGNQVSQTNKKMTKETMNTKKKNKMKKKQVMMMLFLQHSEKKYNNSKNKKMQKIQPQSLFNMVFQFNKFIDAITMKIRFVAAGYFHVFAITDEGVTFGWGRNDFGQLGLGKKDVHVVYRPTRIKSLLDKKIVMMY